jgi:hypothetical protein
MALKEDHKMQSNIEPEPKDIPFEANNQREVENNDFNNNNNNNNNNNETNSEIRITAEPKSVDMATKTIAVLSQQLGRSKNENTRKKQQIEALQKEVSKLQLETDRQTQEIKTLKQSLQSNKESIDCRDVKISEMIQKLAEAEGNELELKAQKALNQKLTEDFTEEFKAKHELLTQHEAVKQSLKTDKDVIQAKLEKSELYNRKLKEDLNRSQRKIDNYYRSFMENNAKIDREFKQQLNEAVEVALKMDSQPLPTVPVPQRQDVIYHYGSANNEKVGYQPPIGTAIVAYDNEEYFVRHYRRNETTVPELKRRVGQTIESKKPFIRKGHDLFAIKIARVDNSSTKHSEYTKETPKRCDAIIHNANPRLMVLPSDIMRESGGYVDIIVVEKTEPPKANKTPLKAEDENKPEIATQTEKWTESDEQFKTGNELILENKIDCEKDEEFETEIESEDESADITKSEIDSVPDIQGDEQIELFIEALESDEDTENENTRRVKAEREEL